MKVSKENINVVTTIVTYFINTNMKPNNFDMFDNDSTVYKQLFINITNVMLIGIYSYLINTLIYVACI